MKIAGVVVLYNPNVKVIDNILSYIDDLSFLYIIDNSDCPQRDILDKLTKLKKTKLIVFCENRGIAHALNRGLKEAYNSGFSHLLTMDQDSSFSEGISQYKFLVERNNDENVAIFATNSSAYSKDKPVINNHVITSGNIILTEKAMEVNGFEECLFIDEVDFDFCEKIINRGYKIKFFPNVVMDHVLGDPVKKYIMGIPISSMNHSYIRDYYIFRNRTFMIRKYPKLKYTYINIMIKDFIKILFIEKECMKKLEYCIRGIKDCLCNRMGKFNDK